MTVIPTNTTSRTGTSSTNKVVIMNDTAMETNSFIDATFMTVVESGKRMEHSINTTTIMNNNNKDRGDSVDLTVSTTVSEVLSDDIDTVSIGSSIGSEHHDSSTVPCIDSSTVAAAGTRVDTIDSTAKTKTVTANTTDLSLIRVAILGCGMMGQEHCSYIVGYSKLNSIRIDYLCDTHLPSIHKCLSVMNDFTVATANNNDSSSTSSPSSGCTSRPVKPTIVLSEDELYDNYLSCIDLLVVATPNYLHTNILLRWGIHKHLTILVEKPVCVSYDQHTQLTNVLSLSSSTDTAGNTSTNSFTSVIQANVWVAMEYRFIPAINKLIQLLPTIGSIKMITIRENRYPFLHKINQWNRYSSKTGDTLVEKCCHFFDLMRLITGKEVQLDKIQSIVQRGINYNDEEELLSLNDTDEPIIDSAYVILPFVNDNHDDNTTNSTTGNRCNISSTIIGCLELCMFAEGSRHQEEIIVTGTNGRVEAYLPENKVYAYTRPSNKQWNDRSVPPLNDTIDHVVYDCSNVKDVHNIDSNECIPTHGGYHYSSTAVEWYKLLQAIDTYKQTNVWNPLVSLHDGLHAVEIGLHATKNSTL